VIEEKYEWEELFTSHLKTPRYFEIPEKFEKGISVWNPICGDKISLFLRFTDNPQASKIISFSGSGCGISIASTSLMLETYNLIDFSGSSSIKGDFFQLIKSLTSYVDKYPLRSKCFFLPLKGLRILDPHLSQ
jgi:NifU-like protein involved in Fe-S cluster formation